MFSNQAGILKLQEGVEKKLEENRVQSSKLQEHKKRYVKLDERLTSLPDRISHDVMVPFTTKAFMPGKLVHTNEIQVLLGENYFLECSAKHAKEICGRRLKQCDQMIEELEKELSLVEGWKSQTNQLKQDQEECQDITEHFSEQQLDEWRKKHAESVQRQRKKEKESSSQITTDEELWQRLEELEVREALEKEWEKEESEDEGESDNDSDSSQEDEPSEDNDSKSDEGYYQDEEIIIGGKKPPPAKSLQRRVSFAATKDEETKEKEIRFTFSDNASEKESKSEYPVHPGDINNLTTTNSSISTSSTTQPKSILKIPDNYSPSEHIIPEKEAKEEVKEKPPAVPFINPVQERIQENEPKTPSGNTQQIQVMPTAQNTEPVIQKPEETTQQPAKKVSKFKAMRAKQKS
eukprot:TRINITY_DN2814_c0_g1_i11.p1 TRINITY_DN2814_c0_g1~~TRINITY_DN2814_c0_g1_i11.p1  ORF type:complete len:406 (-),score=121.92 TRINITY_DN2814_c0_g1_i11:26-1243(-)